MDHSDTLTTLCYSFISNTRTNNQKEKKHIYTHIWRYKDIFLLRDDIHYPTLKLHFNMSSIALYEAKLKKT